MNANDELRQARTGRERLFAELANLRAIEQVDGQSDGLSERQANLNRLIAEADDRIRLLEAAGNPAAREGGADGMALAGGQDPQPQQRGRHVEPTIRDAALRTVERNSAGDGSRARPSASSTSSAPITRTTSRPASSRP